MLKLLLFLLIGFIFRQLFGNSEQLNLVSIPPLQKLYWYVHLSLIWISQTGHTSVLVWAIRFHLQIEHPLWFDHPEIGIWLYCPASYVFDLSPAKITPFCGFHCDFPCKITLIHKPLCLVFSDISLWFHEKIVPLHRFSAQPLSGALIHVGDSRHRVQ